MCCEICCAGCLLATKQEHFVDTAQPKVFKNYEKIDEKTTILKSTKIIVGRFLALKVVSGTVWDALEAAVEHENIVRGAPLVHPEPLRVPRVLI